MRASRLGRPPGRDAEPLDEAAHARFVEENFRRNALAHFAHGCFGMTGFRLVFVPTFVPAYLFALTGSPIMVGLGQSLLQLGAVVSPVVGAAKVERERLVLPQAVGIGWMMRLALLGLALSGFFLPGAWLTAATLFFLLMLGYYLGAQRVAFQVLLAKVIPIERRGRLQGYRNLVGGSLAALLSYWAGAALIEKDLFGNGYAAVFAIAFVLTSIGLSILYLALREPPAATVKPSQRPIDRLRSFTVLLEDRDYRAFLAAQVLATFGRIAMPFCILYAGQRMDVDGAAIGTLSLAYLGADTVSNLFWGHLGDRRGFRLVMIGVVMTWIAALALLIAAQSSWQFHLAFFGLGAALSGYLIAALTLVLEFGQQGDVPMRLALSTTAETSVASLGPLAGGAVAAAFGLVPVFLIAIAGLSAALFVLVFRVAEPRYREDATPGREG